MEVDTNAGFQTDVARDAILVFIDDCHVQAGTSPTLSATRVTSLIENVCIARRCRPDGLPKPLHDLYLDATAHERAGRSFGYILTGLERTALSAIY